MGFLIFFGYQDSDGAAVTEATHESFVGELIELLHFFALDINSSGGANDFEQGSALDVGGDDFRGESDARQKPTEFLGGMGTIAPFEKVAFDRGHQGCISH